MIEIPENVNAFVKHCGDIVADYRLWKFSYWLTPELVICESPVEQLFLAALQTIIKVNDLAEDGVTFRQQVAIGKYRVDFRIGWARKKTRKVVVELDGQNFHDTDEKQRRYEKARDRFLQKEGYKVFHYTGAEIVKNPFTAAAECLAFVTGDSEEELMKNVRGEYEY